MQSWVDGQPIEAHLGPAERRFFGGGFRRVGHRRADVQVVLGDQGRLEARAHGSFTYDGKIRTFTGIHPTDDSPAQRESTEADWVFDDVMEAIGRVAMRHAQASYDVFVHLPIEFPLVADGHRPVSERFRALCDQLLRVTLQELEIPNHVIGGSLGERLTAITTVLGLPQVTTVEAAIAAAEAELAGLDVRDETSRVGAAR